MIPFSVIMLLVFPLIFLFKRRTQWYSQNNKMLCLWNTFQEGYLCVKMQNWSSLARGSLLVVGFVPTRVRKPLDPSWDEVLFCSPSLPHFQLFLAVLCCCLDLGWRVQCKIWRCWYHFSLSPLTQNEEHCSPTVPVGPSELLPSLPGSCWEQQGQESRRCWVLSFPSASTNEAVLTGQEGRRCCRGAGTGLPSLLLQEQCCSTVLCTLVSHLHTLLRFVMVP